MNQEVKVSPRSAVPLRRGYIYVLKAMVGFVAYYKIGRTNNPKNRMSALGVQMPFRIDTIHIAPVDDMHDAELSLHEYFSDKRGYGEWFELEPEDLEIIRFTYPVVAEVA